MVTVVVSMTEAMMAEVEMAKPISVISRIVFIVVVGSVVATRINTRTRSAAAQSTTTVIPAAFCNPLDIAERLPGNGRS